MANWKLDQGSGGIWDVVIADQDGNPIAYDGTEPLAGSIWPGGNRTSLVTLTPAWGASPSLGETTVTVSEADSATLDPSTYSVRLTVDDGDSVKTYYRGTIEILATPGDEVAPPTYVDDDDLRDYAAWIDDLQSDGDQTGFAKQRAKAREWLDDILVNRWKPQGIAQLGAPGYISWTTGGGQDPMPSKWLRDQLAADALMIRGLTKEIVAKRALYLICRAQLGRNGDHPYQDLARGFRNESEELLKTYRAEIDINGDGYADLFINCGATNLR